jgi:hypothetical protein
MLTTIENILTSNRMKSLYWRTGMMIVAVIVGAVLSNLDILAPYVTTGTITFLGLVLGEVSKAINNTISRD